MKKNERKRGYAEIIHLMLLGKNDIAFNKLAYMCADDTGLYIIADYGKAMRELAEANEGET
jgi:hypothetical protein